MTHPSQKNSRIFEFYKKGLLTKVRHIHSFQLFPTLTVALLSFFWAFGQDQSLLNKEIDSIAINDTIPQNKAMLLDQIKRNALEQLRLIEQKRP